MTLFERTKNISKQRGWNLQTTAEKAGLSKNAIYNWKTTEPSKVSLKSVADVLHVSTDYLLGRTDEMNYSSLSENNKRIDLKDTLDDEIMLAFDGHEIPDEDKIKIREYIELLDLKRRSEHE